MKTLKGKRIQRVNLHNYDDNNDDDTLSKGEIVSEREREGI